MVTKKLDQKPIIVHTARSKHTRLLAALSIILLLIIAILTLVFLNVNKKIDSININGETEYIDIVKNVRDSVVSIRTEKSAASGVIINKNGLVLTNYHVISELKKDEKIQVLLTDKRIYTAQIIGADDKADVAILKINTTDLPSIKLGDSDNVKVGEKVIAIGNPFGFDSTVTTGIVSALHRDRGPTEYKDFIQTDASINPGNSGGPLINLKGELIGINTFIIGGEKFSGLGFAIPINLVKRITDQILTKGKVIRAFIGIIVQDILELDKEGDGRILEGAKVILVSNNTPAAKAGLKTGDIIKEINSIKVKSSNQLRNYVAWIPIGEEIKLKILRENETLSIPLIVEEKSEEEISITITNETTK
ncbi:trypsin-like peptidase domain-containing protein [Candidatus Woesearchaeota archaeon]|nr:trypsin-like peptidase domain-containing protein [Candidatus Woesearchaeota archaeon]